MAEEYAPTVLARYLEAINADKPFATGEGEDRHVELAPDHAIRLRGAIDFLDRWIGKAPQAVEMSGPEGGPIRHAADLAKLSDEQLAALERLHADDPD